MTTELHGHASLTVTGAADLLVHGRDPEALDDLRIAAVLTRDGARITAEISRLPKGDDDEGLAVDFTADVERARLGHFGRMLVALADGAGATAPDPDVVAEHDALRSLVEHMLRAVGADADPATCPPSYVRMVFDERLAARGATYRDHSVALHQIDMLLRGEHGQPEPWPDGAAVEPVIERAAAVIQGLTAASHALARVRGGGSLTADPAPADEQWRTGAEMPPIGSTVEVVVGTGQILCGVVGGLSLPETGFRIDGPSARPIHHDERGTAGQWWTWAPGYIDGLPPDETRLKWRYVQEHGQS